MRVHLASDHAAFDLKKRLEGWLVDQGHELVDHGPAAYDGDDDYPTYVLRGAEAVAADAGAFGIVLGGSGNGEAMAANKVDGVRAALVWSAETARLAREHNNANVISIGARMHEIDAALGFVETFLATPFSGAERHARRIAMLERYERTGELPG